MVNSSKKKRKSKKSQTRSYINKRGYNIIKSKDWFIEFLKRNNKWNSYSDHNQLRITRVIECLRLLISDEDADSFYSTILSMICEDNEINEITLDYWSKA